MKKTLVLSLAAVALLAASPVLADNGNVIVGSQDTPVVVPAQEPAPVIVGGQYLEPTYVEGEGPKVGEGYVQKGEDGKAYWVIPRENGNDSVELETKKVVIDGKEYEELVMPEKLIAGPSSKVEEESNAKDSKDVKESKSMKEAVKEAKAAAKKEAKPAAKAGQKVLPNTSAVK